jgi:hypothetical protein
MAVVLGEMERNSAAFFRENSLPMKIGSGRECVWFGNASKGGQHQNSLTCAKDTEWSLLWRYIYIYIYIYSIMIKLAMDYSTIHEVTSIRINMSSKLKEWIN